MACNINFNGFIKFEFSEHVVSATVLFVMQIYGRLKAKKFRGQAPQMFFRDNDRNRVLIAVAFGLASLDIMTMLFNFETIFCKDVSHPEKLTCKFCEKVVLSLVHAFINYPLFALISSPYTFVSSIFGVAFVVWNFVKLGVESNVAVCIIGIKKQDIAKIVGPTFAFLCILLVAFCYRLYKCWKDGVYSLPEREPSVIRKYQVLHLKRLLNLRRPGINQGRLLNTLMRMRNMFKPWYKFPGEIIYCLTVAVFIIYVATNSLIMFYENQNVGAYHISLDGVFYRSCILAIIIYGFLLLHFLYCVQQDTFSIYRGKQKFYEKNDKQYNTTVYRNMVFPGYFIGVMIFGYLIVIVFAFILSYSYFIIPKGKWHILFLLRFSGSYFGARLVFGCIQRLLVRYVLTDRETSKVAVNVKHPNAYAVLSFYMLFVNIVFGFFGAIRRTLLSFLTFLLFVGRIDRNPLMFFVSLDASSWYYGYLRFQNSFKNPVMRCFCQILLEPNATHVDQLTTQDATRFMCRKSKKEFYVNLVEIVPVTNNMARKRWYLAYTLIQNRSLIQYRCIGVKKVFKTQSDDLTRVV